MMTIKRLFVIALIATSMLAASAFIRSLPEDREKQTFVNKVLGMSGLHNTVRVVIDPTTKFCGYATTIGDGEQFIGIDPKCAGPLRQGREYNWHTVGLLTHEIGHLLGGHTTNRTNSYREELEADAWSGWAMQRLGASLYQAQTFARGTATRGSTTHPPRHLRIAAVERGWKKAVEKGAVPPTPPVRRVTPRTRSITPVQFAAVLLAGLALVAFLMRAAAQRNRAGQVGNVRAHPEHNTNQPPSMANEEKPPVMMNKFFDRLLAWWTGLAQRPQSATNQAESAPVASTVAPPENPIPALIEKAYSEGEQNAVDADERIPNPKRIEAGKRAVEGWVMSLYRGPFDPEKKPADRQLQDEIDDADERLRLAKTDKQRIEPQYRDAQDDVPAAEPEPLPSFVIISTGVIGYALALGSTVYEVGILGAIKDSLTRLGTAFVIGGLLGALAIACLYGLALRNDKASAIWTPTPSNLNSQTIAGLLLMLGFAVMRASICHNSKAWLMLVGLLAIEVAIWFYIKSDAVRYRAAHDSWRQRVDNRLGREKREQTMTRRYTSSCEEVKAAAHHKQVVQNKYTARLQRDFDVDAVVVAAVNAYEQGYLSGIDRLGGEDFRGARIRPRNQGGGGGQKMSVAA